MVTAAEAAARDAAAIAAGTPSRTLMQRAGAAAADAILRAAGDRVRGGVAVYAGPGNNGGDAWVVARLLARAGLTVRVAEIVQAKTPDALAERAETMQACAPEAPRGDEAVVVDGLLGTGASGAPRGAIAEAIADIERRRAAGAFVAALDVPSGLDASTGAAEGCVVADLTVSFGTIKRGHLVARSRCGRVVVVDIGLGEHAFLADGAPALVDAAWVAGHVPPILAEAHKGTRKKVAIVGGGEGMCGAAVLAARAAERSGVGMAKLVVAPPSLPVAQTIAPEALAARWPTSRDEVKALVGDWADAVVLGPGLGRAGQTRALAERVLQEWRGPVVMDADALNVFEGETDTLARLLGGRPAVLTPHPQEMARLAGATVDDVLARRFEIGAELAARFGAVILLKGVPTIVSAPDGRRLVSAAGTPALAAAGSGDVLSGIAGTLLAQMEDPLASAACAAWVHGHAAELAGAARATVRGLTLDDVLAALGRAWEIPRSRPEPPVLAELPAVGDRP